ncbi:2-(1,2-epoxy-1,2-dihydrophenyl)acetyl-CoA isomerase [Alkalihalobacillus xiaoxiensis]|uniref:2-(1,2-epoxy-1,2-dihydrophenyl)acetyl-CoA isomerase n=1 Tax=Shouchella xiaoxiensis TaxID=766895 RepID=A0ABS2SX22_9BACI|nr:2-(1,2-epoxy-1,2-dihydrophenyl)acetyl-CoA isomerase [Shouchella xiaoxiensis]
MDYIEYSERDGIATITLNRPNSYNAFSEAMLLELKLAFKRAETSFDVRCILVTGAGKGFCSGQDLKEVDDQVHHGEMIRMRYAPLIKQLRACEKPIIAAVNGVAAGAGFSLALACDFRIIHEKASFVNAFIHVGLIPDSANLLFLTRMIGEAKTLELAVLGEKITADEARHLGLATKVISADRWEQESIHFAKQVADLPTKAIALIKRSLKLVQPNLNAYLEQEAQTQRLAGLTEDHLEGIKAFNEKRPPLFHGK